jgi:hypothetical protein
MLHGNILLHLPKCVQLFAQISNVSENHCTVPREPPPLSWGTHADKWKLSRSNVGLFFPIAVAFAYGLVWAVFLCILRELEVCPEADIDFDGFVDGSTDGGITSILTPRTVSFSVAVCTLVEIVYRLKKKQLLKQR